MGQVKDQFTPKQTTVQERQKNMFEKIRARRNKEPEPDPKEKHATTVRDKLVELDESLDQLIQIKINDLNAEPNDQRYNQKAVAILETIQFHVDASIGLAQIYSKLREQLK